MSDTTNKTCVIVGASHAGVNCAFNLRKEGWQGKIIIYDIDKNTPYHRPPLSKSYIIDGNLDSNLLKPLESYDKENITLKLGVKVIAINKDDKTIFLENNIVQAYDKVVLATGARPFLPPINGIKEAENLFVIRTAEDALKIKKALTKHIQKRVVIIGGGYIGLETAASLKKMGANVTILERESRVLSRVTAPLMSEYFMNLHQENDVSILTKKNVVSIKNEIQFNTVFCDDNTFYKADIIIVGVGIRINAELAKEADLKVEKGIFVNEYAQTSNEHIYAIGDCTIHYNPHYRKYLRLESVQNAVEQSKMAAAAICNNPTIYDTIPWFWSDQYSVKLQMVGLSTGYNKVLLRKETIQAFKF